MVVLGTLEHCAHCGLDIMMIAVAVIDTFTFEHCVLHGVVLRTLWHHVGGRATGGRGHSSLLNILVSNEILGQYPFSPVFTPFHPVFFLLSNLRSGEPS